MSKLSRRISTLLFLFCLLLSAFTASAQESVGRAVTLDDWNARMPVLLTIVAFTLIVTAIFGVLAARRSRRAD